MSHSVVYLIFKDHFYDSLIIAKDYIKAVTKVNFSSNFKVFKDSMKTAAK